MSQLDLALEAELSQRHLSFMESGRALPSREMALKLAEWLDMPLRQRNALLVAAGHAPSFAERRMDDPALKPALAAVQRVLDGHAPNPAIAVDRHWNLVMANAAAGFFLEAVADRSLLAGRPNVLRISLHPGGLAPLIVNLAEWRAHLLARLSRQVDDHADPELAALERELRALPAPATPHRGRADGNLIAVPLRLRVGGEELAFISTITVFGTPLDVTLSELAVESFFPADDATAAFLRARSIAAA